MKKDKGLSVRLLGNTNYSSDNIDVDITLLSKEGYYVGIIGGTAKQLMNGRAEVVKSDLVKLGVDPSKISTGEGTGNTSLTTTVEVTKTK